VEHPKTIATNYITVTQFFAAIAKFERFDLYALFGFLAVRGGVSF
jgi:hypothetical protein